MTLCKNCGQDVGFSFTIKNYCNARCIAEFKKKSGYYKKIYRKLNPLTLLKICEVCSVKFQPTTNGKKYCSAKCLVLSSHIKRNPKILIGVPLSVYRKMRILGLL